MGDVYIVGIDMLKFSKSAGVAPEVLGAEAAINAMDEAGVTIKDIGALYAGSAFTGGIAQRLQKQIGQTGIPSASVSNACATGATAFREAMFMVKAGVTNIALAVGCEVMPRGLLGGAGEPEGITTEGLTGSATMPART